MIAMRQQIRQKYAQHVVDLTFEDPHPIAHVVPMRLSIGVMGVPLYRWMVDL